MSDFLEKLNKDECLPCKDLKKEDSESQYFEPKDTRELARAYVHMQKFNKVYPLGEGLIKGTAFPELYKPMSKSENQPVCD